MRPIRVAWVAVGIIEGRLERDGIGGFEIGKTGVAVGWIFEKSCGIPVDVLWRRSVSYLSSLRGKRADCKRSVRTPLEFKCGLHRARGFGPYGRRIFAKGPKGGIVSNVERPHDALAVRVLLVVVECRYEESGFVESNAEVRTTLFNGKNRRLHEAEGRPLALTMAVLNRACCG